MNFTVTISTLFIKTLDDTTNYINELLGKIQENKEEGEDRIIDYLCDAFAILYEQQCAIDYLIDLIYVDNESREENKCISS